MVKCAYCGKDIDYLPFKCRYCHKYYCREHRLPENHACTYEFREESLRELNQKKTVSAHKILYSDDSMDSRQRGFRPTRPRNTGRRGNFLGGTPIALRNILGAYKKPVLTYTIMVTSIVMFILSFFSQIIPYIFLNSVYLIPPFYRYSTLLTAMFIPTYPSFFSFINVIFFLIMIWFTVRMIELRFGWKLALKLYIFGALFTTFGILLIQLSLLLIGGISFNFIGYITSWGALNALIAFSSRDNPEVEITMLLWFFPVRIKKKHILTIFIVFDLIFGLMNLIAFNPYFIDLFSNILGALAGLLLAKKYFRRGHF
ncbi:MAG: AN1-type zinc finger domain-containing protein [Promethearchaeota archaeon]